MKKTKLKFAAAVAALAMTFAFVTSCGNASDVVDEIVNGGGDDSGTTDTGAKDDAEEEATPEEIADDGAAVIPDSSILFEGSTKLSWEAAGAITIDASKLSNITENTVFKFTYSVSTGAEYTNLNIKNSAETDIVIANPDIKATYYTTVIGSAEAVEDFKKNGIIIKGSNMTVTKIEILGEQVTVALTYQYGTFGTRADLEAIQKKAYTGYSKIVVKGTYNEYTPSYNWDGVAALCGWKADVGEEWGAYSDEGLKDFNWNTGCYIADYADKVGSEYTVSFSMDDILSCNDEIYRYGINVYTDSAKNPKVTVDSVAVTYIAK